MSTGGHGKVDGHTRSCWRPKAKCVRPHDLAGSDLRPCPGNCPGDRLKEGVDSDGENQHCRCRGWRTVRERDPWRRPGSLSYASHRAASITGPDTGCGGSRSIGTPAGPAGRRSAPYRLASKGETTVNNTENGQRPTSPVDLCGPGRPPARATPPVRGWRGLPGALKALIIIALTILPPPAWRPGCCRRGARICGTGQLAAEDPDRNPGRPPLAPHLEGPAGLRLLR